MKENIKLGLLGLIALTLLVNTYYTASKKSPLITPNAQAAASGAVTPNPGNLPIDPSLGTTIQNSPPPAVPAQKATRMTFDNYQHNFGTIKQNTTNTYSFRFTNTGTEPLLITNATGDCGCTVPDYPRDPIAPGKSATINVEYKPGTQKGTQSKNVTLTANTEPRETILTIRAEVEE